MSRDFYFHKWRETLKRLRVLIDLDMDFQVLKTHDPTLPKAVHRLCSILDHYMLLYNEAIECLHQNLQVQKTMYMEAIINAVVSRILELKHELEKLEGSNIQFIGHGITEVHRTIFDVEMTAITMEMRRPEHIQSVLEETLVRAKEKKATLEMIANMPEEEEEAPEVKEMWWEKEEKNHDNQEKKVELPEEVRVTIEFLNMIAAHEKTRQVTRMNKVNTLKREMWEKELMGLLQPPARYKIREKSAKIIQQLFRAYFKLKRTRIEDCKRDELLGLNVCDTPNKDIQRKALQEILQNRVKVYPNYEKEWIVRRDYLKKQYLEGKRDQLCEETCDQIREWLFEWFEAIQFFPDIPKVGCAAIFKGLIPDPHKWLEENKALTLQKEANKKKSPQDLKFEKMEAKRQQQALKREEQMKKKAEAQLLKKMMKNPNMHPGYIYPQSKRIKCLIEVINEYHTSWDSYDERATLDVKVKYVNRVDVENAIMEARLEVLPEVDEHMRKEVLKLKQALKEDYIRNEEEMPVDVTKPIKGEKKKKQLKDTLTDQVIEIMENLYIHGFIKEYPRIKIEDFIGDPNFGGEDLRAQIQPAFPFNFEVRAFWWERCREVSHGFRRILLVGPENSGKTVLVHALASINNAVLFELDPVEIQSSGVIVAPYLKLVIHNVVLCARAVQPSVIHIKHIQKLFYSKVPPEEAEMNLGLLKTFFVQKLMKKIRKTDKITVIGTCVEPWLAKSSALLKQFPVILLLPDNTYSTVVQMLKEWVVRHKVLPSDLNVSNLAYVLQGYSFGYLKEALDKFMAADRVVKIAAFGVTPMNVYDYILEDETETKIEYDRYLKWYSEKTVWGAKEKQHIQDQKEFKAAVEKYAAKNKKKAKSAPSSTTPSRTGL